MPLPILPHLSLFIESDDNEFLFFTLSNNDVPPIR